jgi:hypothetical protein
MVDDSAMLANDLTLRGDNATRIDPQAHGPIGKRRRDAVVIAFQMHKAVGVIRFVCSTKAWNGPATSINACSRQSFSASTDRKCGTG